jgi:integrase
MATLTARFVEAVKGQPGKRLEIRDEVIQGLSLRVSAAGAKTWALRWRLPSGHQRRLTLGQYPALSLKAAREEAIKALGVVAVARDPAAEKMAQQQQARRGRLERPQTLADLWPLFKRDKFSELRQGTQEYYSWLWGKWIEPEFGNLQLSVLDRRTVREGIKQIGEAAPATANRVLALIRSMLNYGVEEDALPANPLAKIKAEFAEKSRDRVLSDRELKALWTALEAAPARADVHVSGRAVLAIKLQLLTATRAGDVSGMHVEEIDVAARSWTIPAARHKSGKAHTIPLSATAWDLISAAFDHRPTDEWSGFAFPMAGAADQPMKRASLTRAMSRVMADLDLPRTTPHDLRRTAATMLASERIGVAPHIVSAVLGHTQEGPAVTGVYNRHRYDREKRAALEAWAALLTEIVSDKARPSNVRPLKRDERPA